jgi:hypothetical protein
MIVLNELGQIYPVFTQSAPVPALAEKAALVGEPPRRQHQQSIYRCLFN